MPETDDASAGRQEPLRPSPQSPQVTESASVFAGLLAPEADGGLLVIHGVGGHQKTTTLRAMLDPFLDRLSAEGLLVNASAATVGEDDKRAGFAGLRVRYRHAKAAGESQLLVVEGRWDDSFLKESSEKISSWVTRSAPRMVFEVLRYHWRSWWRGLGGVVVLGLFALAVGEHETVAGTRRLGLSVGGLEDLAWYWYAVAALMLTLVLAWPDTSGFRRQPMTRRRKCVYIVALLGTLVVNQLQRGIVIVVTAAGIVLAPAAFMTLRWLSSIPFISGAVKSGLLPKVEGALLLGGFADMEAIVATPVTAAAIREHLREALMTVESGVKAGGTITVVAHSGGAPLAWNLLSEPEIRERQAAKSFRYRLITAGAALTWAKHGFEGDATPLNEPLVNWNPNADLLHPNPEATQWCNVYGAWDPVPHGPINPAEFDGYTTEDRDRAGNPLPNRLMRNLGAPVPDEHGEYWRNQQEFVPLLGRALDGRFAWAQEAKNDEALLTNCRLSLLSTLVRTRMVVLALPFAALLAGLRGTRFLPAEGEAEPGSPFVRAIGFLLRHGGKLLLGDSYDGVQKFLRDSPALVGLIVTVLLLFAALALMDLYTNVCWHRLGRHIRGLRPTDTRLRWFPLPIGASIWTWLPVAAVIPLLLWQMPIRESAKIALSAANLVFLLLDIAWLGACVGAMTRTESDTVRIAMKASIGRGQDLDAVQGVVHP